MFSPLSVKSYKTRIFVIYPLNSGQATINNYASNQLDTQEYNQANKLVDDQADHQTETMLELGQQVTSWTDH